MSIARMLIALSLTLATARADVIVIDPGAAPGHPLLKQALANAAPGDVLLLEPGDYLQDFFAYVIDKGITLLPASAGARITLGSIQLQNLPAGQAAVLRGFDVQVFPGAGMPLIVTGNEGTAWIEDCTFTGHAGGGIHYTNEIGGDGVEVFKSRAIFRNCSFTGGVGGDALIDFAWGGDGLRVLESSTVALYDCTLVGGEYGSGPSYPMGFEGAGRALSAIHSDVTVSGCTLTGGKEGADNEVLPGTSGSAILAAGHAHVRVLQSVLVPGAVQGSGTQSRAVTVMDSTVAILSEPARSLVLPALATVGQTVTLLLDGETGDLALTIMSPVAGALPMPTLEGTLALQPGSFGSPVSVGVLPGPDGQLSLPLASGLLPPGVEGMMIFAQGVFVDADGRSLGGASAITWLAAGP